MYSRLKGKAIVLTLFVIISIRYYELALNDALIIRPILTEITEITDEVKVSGNETFILLGMERLDEKRVEVERNAESMDGAF